MQLMQKRWLGQIGVAALALWFGAAAGGVARGDDNSPASSPDVKIRLIMPDASQGGAPQSAAAADREAAPVFNAPAAAVPSERQQPTRAARSAGAATDGPNFGPQSPATSPAPFNAPLPVGGVGQPASAGPSSAANASGEVLIEGDRGGSRQPAISARVLPDNSASGSAGPASSGGPPAAAPGKSGSAEGLKPVPAAPSNEPVGIEASSFNGVTPGISTVAEMKKSWGEPKETRKVGPTLHYLYGVGPFKRIEVTSVRDKVSAVQIRFDKPFPAATVAQQLDLARIRPVLVPNEMGDILGQSFPERGVLMLFEPSAQAGQPSLRVTEVVLEAVTAEPFVLRAETNIETKTTLSLQDLEQALKLDHDNGRAHWLKARVLTAMGDVPKAQAAAAEAVRLEPDNPQYHVTRAQILGQAGDFTAALEEGQRALASAQQRPHVKARAQCLMGDLLASSPTPDYKQAMRHHMEAIQLADPLIDNPHPALRRPAREVLIDAHLGAAHDIAWGNWRDKGKAIDRWLSRAMDLTDEMVKAEDAGQAPRLHLATRALATCVGARGVVDPTPWVERTLSAGEALLLATDDPAHKAQYQWDLGMALYDALQVYQIRGEHEAAMKYGKLAIDYLEQGQPKDSPSAAYLLGRLYFRMGAVHALRDQDHKSAVTWFDKALPLLDRPLPPESAGDAGRQGETFVSMGVSFWEAGQQDRGIRLSQRGVTMMEQAVKAGLLEEGALVVAYNNLATMHKQLGEKDNADRYETLAARTRKNMQK